MSDQEKEEIQFDLCKAYVAKAKNHPRGVFAKKDIQEGETIEIFPITPIQFRTEYQFDKGVLNYVYVNDSCECQECTKHGHVMFLPMGYGGIYNFTNEAESNAKIVMFYESFFAKVVATKNISKDEEILTNFSETYFYRQMMKNENNK